MRLAAWAAVILGALLVVVTPVAAQTLTLPDAEDAVEGTLDAVTSTVEETAATVGETADSLTGSSGTSLVPSSGSSAETSGGVGGGSSSSSGGAPGGASTPSESTTSSSTTRSSSPRSGSGGGGEKAGSRATRHRTAFDRLPRRLEALLERIEFGRNVRANLRRLEEAFASAPPALRTRILRLLRVEIRRLRADGTTPAERKRIKRLQRAKRVLANSTAPAAMTMSTGSSVQASGTSPAANDAVVRALATSRRAGDVTAGQAKPGPAEPGGVLGAQTDRGDGDASPGMLPEPLVPKQPDEFPFGMGVILLVLFALGVAGVVAAVTSHVLRHMRSG